MEGVLDHLTMSDGLAVVPVETQIYIKLVAKQSKNMTDVIELVKAGADLMRVRNYLKQYANDLIPMFEELVTEAIA